MQGGYARRGKRVVCSLLVYIWTPSSYLVFPHEVPLYNSLPLLAPPTTFSQPSLSSILLASSLPIINNGLSRTSSLAARWTRTNGLVQTLPGPLKMPSVALWREVFGHGPDTPISSANKASGYVFSLYKPYWPSLSTQQSRQLLPFSQSSLPNRLNYQQSL